LKKTFFNASGVAVFLFASFAPLAAMAATPTPSTTPGQGLEISPPVIQITGDPGQTVTTQVRLRDITSGQLVAKSEVNDFGAQGESGQPKLIFGSDANNRFSLKSWVQPVGDVTLNPGELRTISLRIVIPRNAEPGGHYGVIRFSALPPGLNSTGVSLSASIGTLVLLRVSGNVTEKLQLLETFVEKNGHRGSFFQKSPVTFVERFQNNGTVHLSPVGTLVVKDIFGHQVAKLDVNKTNGNVLPDSVRRFDQAWSKKGLFGYYTVAVTTGYGTHGQVIEGPATGFWVVPVVPVLVILALLLLIFFGLKFGLRRYNAHILAQARKR
jgi:hypothetical protein